MGPVPPPGNRIGLAARGYKRVICHRPATRGAERRQLACTQGGQRRGTPFLQVASCKLQGDRTRASAGSCLSNTWSAKNTTNKTREHATPAVQKYAWHMRSEPTRTFGSTTSPQDWRPALSALDMWIVVAGRLRHEQVALPMHCMTTMKYPVAMPCLVQIL